MSHHHVARAVERSSYPAEEGGTDLLVGMGTPVSTRINIACSVEETSCAFSQESPPCGKSSPMTLKLHRDDFEGDVSYLSSQLAIEDILPDNLDVVAKQWDKSDRLVHCDFLADVGTTETAYRCRKVVHASTMHGGRYQMVVLARNGGRSHIMSWKEPSTHGLEPCSTISHQVLAFGSLDSSERSVGVPADMSDIHRQDNQRLLSIKADGNADTAGVKNTNRRLWRRRETHGLKTTPSRPVAAAFSYSCVLVPTTASAECKLDGLLWQSSTMLSSGPSLQGRHLCHLSIN